jgi:hypothetical protein
MLVCRDERLLPMKSEDYVFDVPEGKVTLGVHFYGRSDN